MNSFKSDPHIFGWEPSLNSWAIYSASKKKKKIFSFLKIDFFPVHNKSWLRFSIPLLLPVPPHVTSHPPKNPIIYIQRPPCRLILCRLTQALSYDVLDSDDLEDLLPWCVPSSLALTLFLIFLSPGSLSCFITTVLFVCF